MAMPAVEILVVEDADSIREGLALLLEGEGYAVRTAPDGEAALAAFRERRPSIVLLDVMMPGVNGYAVCREIRKTDPSTPVVFLTARDGDADELRGMEAGADDYVPKTASEPVLLAHIAAAARRIERRAATAPCDDAAAAADDGFAFGEWKVDAQGCRLLSASGAQVELTLKEVEILRWFRTHPNEVFSRDFLVTRFWGLDFEGDDSALTTALSRLRDKLGRSGALIETVYGRGYRLRG